MKFNPLSRRRFLGGSLGASVLHVALPRLSPMLDSHGVAWANGDKPLRYLTFGFGCGVVTQHWNPTAYGQGSAWSLPPALAPLAKWKSHMSVVTAVNVEGAGSHGTGNIVYLSGARASRSTGPSLPTLDQQIGAKTKAFTPLKSLEVGLIDNQDDRTVGHLYWSHNGPKSPNPPLFDPKAVFDRLFGAGTNTTQPDPQAAQTAEKIRGMKKSVLDFVAEDAQRLRAELPASDKRRLDQHLTAVRELEQRLSKPVSSDGGTQPPSCKTPGAVAASAPPNSFAGADKIVQPMAKLMALAFACDITRVGTFQTTQAASRASWSDLGIANWHGTSHDGSAAGQEKIQKVVVKHMEWLKVLATEFEQTPDGAGNLLDACAILTVNEVGQGWTHQSSEMPTLILGKAGGNLKGDVALRLGGWCGKVCLTVAHAVGVPLTSFGGGGTVETQPIAALLNV
ncbi:MAG: DUF1552 domain-containing protein [Deltaproteobacteria bacterium]|nr:DUF1552 domain-containing protein [Deltaproteobacteria bacterium]